MHLFRPSYSDVCPKTGRKVRKKTRKWYAKYRDETGKVRRVPLSEDKRVAQQMMAKLIREVEAGRHGLADPFAEHRRKPLAQHLADYEANLRSRGVTESHVRLVVGRVRRLVAECGFRTMADISPSRVQAFLAELRRAGLSIQTANFYLQGIKQFCRWLVRDRRLETSPVAFLSGGNVRLDRRRERRDLSHAELAVLVAAARQGQALRGLSGPDRALLYTTAVYTGLRASELASLTPENFNLDGEPATVCVEAAYSKHRRQDVLPLHPELARLLREWLMGKTKGARVWPGAWASGKEAGVMLRHDLAQAGLPYRDERGRVADFHALRHTFISNLVRAGVPPKMAQVLARHSTITLTMDRYSHVDFAEQVRAVAFLPALPLLACTPACRPEGQGAVPTTTGEHSAGGGELSEASEEGREKGGPGAGGP